MKIPTIKNPTNAGRADLKGISPHCLATEVEMEVVDGGLTRDAMIYQIEDLKGPPGIIRRRGAELDCPMTHKRGAAYVHCLEGEDNVGDATHMLSYSWGYKLGDIVDTLLSFCHSHSLNPKRTYFWICCFCVNQHRVVENYQSNTVVPTDVFLTAFETRVLGIGRVVCMMSPWNDPVYLSRVWCIFEIYTAIKNSCSCEVYVAMPPSENDDMMNQVFVHEGKGLHVLYNVLSKTKIEDAKASVMQDRDTILQLVRFGDGYRATNITVNKHVRAWVRRRIVEKLRASDQTRKRTNGLDRHDDLEHARICNEAGNFFHAKEEYEDALVLHKRALFFRRKILGILHADTATSEFQVGFDWLNIGNLGEALVSFRRALFIREKTLSKYHIDIANSHKSIAFVYKKKEKFEEALIEFHKVLGIQKVVLGEENSNVANSHMNIGLIFAQMERFDEALVALRKARDIYEVTSGEDHLNTVDCRMFVGGVLAAVKETSPSIAMEALREISKAISVYESTLGKDHPRTNGAKRIVSHLISFVERTQGFRAQQS